MKKIVLFLVIFLNLFTYVESSPIISPAGIIIATKKKNLMKNLIFYIKMKKIMTI